MLIKYVKREGMFKTEYKIEDATIQQAIEVLRDKDVIKMTTWGDRSK